MKHHNKQEVNLKRLQNVAISRKGFCLSKEYKGQKTNLTWKCEKGHIWEASPSSILYLNTWCPLCAGNNKLTIADANKIAIRNGGRCLSNEYKNSKQKMLWQCKKGHQWYATLFSIKIRNSWCPECYKIFIHKRRRNYERDY